MELSGEEKKLQALFSELKTADEQTAPRCARVWNRAQPETRRVRAFNPAFVGATVLLICALISLAVWSRYSQRTVRPDVAKNAGVPAAPVKASTSPVTTNPTIAPLSTHDVAALPSKRREITVASTVDRSKAHRHAQVIAANRKLTQEAKTISSWQSPTSALLTSPSDELFRSLPQLNESSTELKSFLPNRPN